MTKKFNLKKMSASKNVTITEKRNIKLNNDFDQSAVDDSGNYDYRLKDGRKNPTGDEPYEKMLKKVRTSKDDAGITEGEMNKANLRSDKMNKTPLMDYSKENSNKLADDFKQANDKEDRDTSFWDDGVGSQMLGEKTTIVNNVQKSQLLSSYKSREEFEKMNKMAQSTLKDADALLYSLFRKAADERRELTEQENQIVLDINSGKIRVLSQFKPTGEFDYEALAQEEAAEDLEERARIEEALEQAKLEPIE